MLPTPVFLGFPGGLDGKESAFNTGDLDSIPGWEDPLEEDMATHSSILIWRIPRTEEPGGLQSIESQSRAQLSVRAQRSFPPLPCLCHWHPHHSDADPQIPSLDFLLLIPSLISYHVLSFLSLKYLPVSSVCPGLIICYLDCL